MARVVLLNPPTPRRPVLRDFACGETTKADYYWAPIDLLVLSGVLTGHTLLVVDAVAEGLTVVEALARIARFAPDVVFSLIAAVTLADDDGFFGEVKRATGARIYAFGDCASFEPERTLQRTASLDGACQNFADPTLSSLADGRVAEARSIVLRGAHGAIESRTTDRLDPMRYPRPQHEIFPLHRYRMPFTRWDRSTTVLTSYGCPFPCTFCPSRNLPWQLRPLEDVLAEFEHIRALGLREVYVRDFTFGPTRSRGHAFCDMLIARDLGIRWSAECRLDVLDEPLLDRMCAAGCEVILCGIETSEADVSGRLGKRIPNSRTARMVAHARALGIRVAGHFVLGSPGETPEQLLRTIRFACEIPIDYASFNLYAPRLGTEMRSELVRSGRVDGENFGEQDVSQAAQAFAAMPGRQLAALHRRAVLQFYLRPRHLARLLRVTPWSTLARQGVGVLRNVLESHA